ncbi:UDP-N-acetylenolpyruvoylglucosamine reductase [Ahniella affigens]|uniref:UDP-N-acetylenolpyruvoylglucosamine reductase n=1 Tax=Ahniella affigens TaxID=2021234 RepID=A0A2P1PPV7_9GAMM|nr:UDP-N-acetylmuramate dehydrogenase [Ahniella affigens]AVP96875.1 UDP-N-acetylenolpyruvoylglucosamine reductase [Ahniella affigens]
MAETGYHVTLNASLLGRNTLRVAAQAERLIEVFDPTCLPQLLAQSGQAHGPIRVLGGGSNLLLSADVPGTVLKLCNEDVHWPDPNQEHAIVRAGAGLNWHALVMASLERGWQGLENLALIPGTVGAAPIQNIGAYGLEVGERIVAVEVYDRDTHQFRTLPTAACAFAYRDSLFKREPDRFVVVAVQFALHRHAALRTHYQGIADELRTTGVITPTARDVAEAVIRLRQRKLPDPALLPNAGSYFKNPMVDADTLADLKSREPDLVYWPSANGGAKLSAGWLIERASLKGARDGDAGIAPGHALVLVNFGQASGADLRRFAARVQATVKDRFGVHLEPEPVCWP